MFFHAASIYIWERRKEKKKNNLELNSKEKIIKHFITQPLFRKCGRILKKEKKKENNPTFFTEHLFIFGI